MTPGRDESREGHNPVSTLSNYRTLSSHFHHATIRDTNPATVGRSQLRPGFLIPS